MTARDVGARTLRTILTLAAATVVFYATIIVLAQSLPARDCSVGAGVRIMCLDLGPRSLPLWAKALPVFAGLLVGWFSLRRVHVATGK